MKLILPTTLIAVSVLCTQVEAGLFSLSRSNCGENTERCCEPECKSVKVKKKCWKTECEEVILPPVCIPSCRDIFRSMCPGNDCCGMRTCNSGSKTCGQGSCCEAGCCPQSSPCSLPNESCGNGLLAKLLGKHAKCKVRCVNKLKSHSYESEKTEVEWKIQHRCGDCAECGSHCTYQ